MNIGCIIVIYNPNLKLFQEVINSIKNQVYITCIVDNSSKSYECIEELGESVHYIKMEKNVGIAKAQNIGLKYFQDLKVINYVFFLDQDSIVPVGMVKQLEIDFNYLLIKNIKVGGVGPIIINRQSNEKYKFKAKNINDIVYLSEVTELMNSASLIPLVNFYNVGLMDETLFIDGVDHEWCWRAKKLQKLKFFISENTQLSHQLGEGDKSILIKNIAIPTPFRTYFQFRNYFLLLKRNYVPLHWKLLNGFKYSVKYFYYPLAIKPRKEYLKNINKGIYDGLKLFFS